MSIKSVISFLLALLLRPTRELRAKATQVYCHALLRSSIKGTLCEDVLVLGRPEIRGTGNIEIASNARIYPGVYLETRGEGKIVIGRGAVLSRGVHIVSRSLVTIGDGTMIGEYSSLRDANHVRQPRKALRYSGHKAREIWVGEEVWIGRGVIVLPGVSVGSSATIGANAVVTRDVCTGDTVAGVPAISITSRPVRDVTGNAQT